MVGNDALRDHPVLDDVRDARRRAKVVLEDAELARGIADEVDPGDVDPDAVRGAHAAEPGQVVLRAEDDLGRHPLRAEDALLAVNVVEERLERSNALHDPALDAGPVLRRDDARDEAEGEDLLGAAHGRRRPRR